MPIEDFFFGGHIFFEKRSAFDPFRGLPMKGFLFKGGMDLTQSDIGRIIELQKRGLGYKRISAETNLPVNSVKTYCRRHPIDSVAGNCEYCQAPLVRLPHTKEKRFCSDNCRNEWWKAHPEAINRKKQYPHTCRFCGREFYTSRESSGFCSRKCFADFRRKEGRA